MQPLVFPARSSGVKVIIKNATDTLQVILHKMDVTISREDIDDNLFFLEELYRKEPSEKLAVLINTIRTLRYPGVTRISFPTGTPDVDRAVALFLTDRDLNTFCRLNQYMAEICRDELFWAVKIWQRYGVKLDKYLGPNDSQKKAYIALSKNYLRAAAQRGYFPIIKQAYETGKLTRIEARSLASYAARGDHPEVLIYLDEHFNIVDNDWIYDYSVFPGSWDILMYIINKIGISSPALLGRALAWAAKNKEDDFVRKILREFSTIRTKILTQALSNMHDLIISPDLLKELYPAGFVPRVKAILSMLKYFSANKEVITEDQNQNLRYMLSLASNDPSFVSILIFNIGARELIVLVKHVDDPERFIQKAIYQEKEDVVIELSARLPYLISNNDLLMIDDDEMFRRIIDNLPDDYDYSMELLDKLSATKLRIIADHLKIDIEGDRDVVIGAILQKLHDSKEENI